MLARDPDPRNRPRIGAAAVRDHIPGAATARNVHATDQRLVVQAVGFARPCFQDADAVDELELVGCRREAADANAYEIAIDAVSIDPLGDEFLVRQGAVTRVDRLMDPRRWNSVFALSGPL